jgi:hypothetical protein
MTRWRGLSRKTICHRVTEITERKAERKSRKKKREEKGFNTEDAEVGAQMPQRRTNWPIEMVRSQTI